MATTIPAKSKSLGSHVFPCGVEAVGDGASFSFLLTLEVNASFLPSFSPVPASSLLSISSNTQVAIFAFVLSSHIPEEMMP